MRRLKTGRIIGGRHRINTREQIARWLRVYKLGIEEGDDPNCITPWDECNQETKDRWLEDADDLLAFISPGGKHIDR